MYTLSLTSFFQIYIYTHTNAIFTQTNAQKKIFVKTIEKYAFDALENVG